jgi:hypothetical protein
MARLSSTKIYRPAETMSMGNRRINTPPQRCLGWPAGTECCNIPGTQWGPFWCGPCNEKRLAHISANLAAIEAKMRSQSDADEKHNV